MTSKFAGAAAGLEGLGAWGPRAGLEELPMRTQGGHEAPLCPPFLPLAFDMQEGERKRS